MYGSIVPCRVKRFLTMPVPSCWGRCSRTAQHDLEHGLDDSFWEAATFVFHQPDFAVLCGLLDIDPEAARQAQWSALDISPETGDCGALAAGHPRFTLKLLSAYMSGVEDDSHRPLSSFFLPQEGGGKWDTVYSCTSFSCPLS